MRYLVAGGAGFIGQNLVGRLLSTGNNVVVLDDFSTGCRDFPAEMPDAGRLEVVEVDITSSAFWLDVERLHSRGGPFDAVINLACPASPPRYQVDPVKTMLTSVVGTERLLAVAVDNSARFLQASTSEVYGDPSQHPQHESYLGAVNCTGPRACYDEGKRAAEALCFDYRRARRASVRVARIFNTYGPCMHPDDGRVVSNFVVQALAGEPITVYGDGSQTRSFCYVDDMVDGLLRLLWHDDDHVGPVNLGNPAEFTILDLATEVTRQVGSQVGLVFKPLPVDDPRQRRPDIGAAVRLLGWEPRVALRDGLAKTVAYFTGAGVWSWK